jgi:hypothetical protein
MSSEDKPKIIVDDDWKTRVQAEKESLAGKPGEAPASPPVQTSKPVAKEVEEEDLELPPASFETLVSMLVTQTLAALGQIPLGDEQRPVVMLNHAKHYIDMLGMLEEKTKGNLSSAEANMLSHLLHELRMVFVSVKKNQPA